MSRRRKLKPTPQRKPGRVWRERHGVPLALVPLLTWLASEGRVPGVCPGCGGDGEVVADAEGWRLHTHHREDTCPVLLDLQLEHGTTDRPDPA